MNCPNCGLPLIDGKHSYETMRQNLLAFGCEMGVLDSAGLRIFGASSIQHKVSVFHSRVHAQNLPGLLRGDPLTFDELAMKSDFLAQDAAIKEALEIINE